MIIWLIPVGLFWTAGAMYLGGFDIEFEGGGGLRQTLGLTLTFALFLALWWLLGKLLAGIGPILGALVIPSLLSVLALPLLSRFGFRLAGVRIRPGHPAGGGHAAGSGHAHY